MQPRHLWRFLSVAAVTAASSTVWAQPVEWTRRAVSGPSPRNYHAMAYDSARGVTVLFGGGPGVGPGGGETWEWNGTDWTQRVVSGPSPRYGHAMAYDLARGVTVLFGGQTDSTNNGETWEWNGTAWTQRAVSGPSPRSVHAMAYDAASGVTVLFGGGDGETWEWNGTAWTQRLVSGPSPRFGHAMAYDATRGVTVLFGGSTGGNNNDETWEWDGTDWTQRVVSGPSRRHSHAMAYDAASGVTVLFGGQTDNGRILGETWEWNGTAWTVSDPFARSSHAMAYDAARGVTVLFGGDSGSGLSGGDTWVVRVPCTAPSITQQPAGQSVLSLGTATFTVAASAPPAGGALTYQWRRNGGTLADGPFGNGSVVHGAGTPFLAITSVALADSTAAFDCIVTNTCGSTTSSPAGLCVMSSCTADFNDDGFTNSQDFFDYLAAFFNGCP